MGYNPGFRCNDSKAREAWACSSGVDMASYKVLSVSDLDTSTLSRDAFALDVLLGLSGAMKSLPSKYFYDARGSELFQRISELDEYYPTRTEFEILETHGRQIAAQMDGARFNLVELGAGDGRKTKVLLGAFLNAGLDFSYVPIDISEDAMADLTATLAVEFPRIECRGLVAEYYQALHWLNQDNTSTNLVLFLGSNIGNFNRPQARVFLRTLWNALNSGDMLLTGFDLKKDIDILLRAYNDSAGITEAFNLNLLSRINRELGGNFDLSRFEHFGTYDVFSGAMESYLLSLGRQTVRVAALDCSFEFRAYEPIHTEYSYKYLPEDAESLARETGFTAVGAFYDSKRWFCDMLWRADKKLD